MDSMGDMMNKKLILLIIIGLIIGFFLGYLVKGAFAIFPTVASADLYPTNASQVTSRNITFEVNFTQIERNTVYRCNYSIGLPNGSFVTTAVTEGNAGNMSLGNTTYLRWRNQTSLALQAHSPTLNYLECNSSTWVNWTIFCNHTADNVYYNVFNTTSEQNYLLNATRFVRFNTITPTPVSPANATVYNTNRTINMTINSQIPDLTVGNCTYRLGLSNGTQYEYYDNTQLVTNQTVTFTANNTWVDVSPEYDILNITDNIGNATALLSQTTNWTHNNTGVKLTVRHDGYYGTGVTYNITYHRGYRNLANFSNETDNQGAQVNSWANITEFTIPDNQQNAYGKYHNITWRCNETGFGTDFRTSNVTYFGYDYTNPVVANLTSSILNASSDGNILRIEFNITENNTDGASYLAIYYAPSGAKANKTATAKIAFAACGLSSGSAIYQVNLSQTELTENGLYYIGIWANDTAGNSVQSENYTVAVHNLYEDEWNNVVIIDNKSLSEVANMMPNITYVSFWNNDFNWKNFTTWQSGLSTNANIQGNGTLNATYIYCEANNTLIENISNFVDTWASLNPKHMLKNQTAYSNGWNYFGFANMTEGLQRISLNLTMYGTRALSNYTLTKTNDTLRFAANNTGYILNETYLVNITSIGNATVSLEGGTGGNWSIVNNSAVKLTVRAAAGSYTGADVQYNVTYEYSPNYAYMSNITYISYYNASIGQFCSVRRGYLTTSCPDLESNTTYVSLTDGFWLLTNNNITLNRTLIGLTV